MASKKKIINVEIKPELSGIRNLNNEISKMRSELDEATDAKHIDKLNKELGKTEKQVVDINEAVKKVGIGKKFEDAFDDLAPLSSRLGELEDQMYELAFAGKADSEAFRELQQEAVKMRQTIIETDKQVDILADNKGMSVFSDGIGQVGASMARLDFETASKQATSLAGAAGKISFGSAMKSMKQFGSTIMQLGKAILMNPLFLLAAVIAAVGYAVYKLLDALGVIKVIFEAVGKAIGWVVQQLKNFLDWLGLTNYAEQDAAEKSAKSAERRAKAYETASKRITQALDTEIKLAELAGESTEALEKKKLEVTEATTEKQVEALRARFKAEKIKQEMTHEEMVELRQQLEEKKLLHKKSIDDLKIFGAEEAAERRDAIIRDKKAKAELAGDTIKAQTIQLKKERDLALRNEKLTQNEILLIKKQFNDEVAELEEADRAERYAKWKAWKDNRVSTERLIQDIETDLLEDGIDKELQANNYKFDRLIEDTKRDETINQKERLRLVELYGKQRTEAEAQLREKNRLAEADAKLKEKEQAQTDLDKLTAWYAKKDALERSLIQDQYEKEKAERTAQFEDRIATLEAEGLLTNAIELKIKKKLQNDLDAIDKKANDEKKAADAKSIADAKSLSEAKANMAVQGLQLVASVAELFADKSETAARVAFNVQKAASIAQATMDGYKAVISTYANAPGGVVLKGIQAGIAGAFAAVQIANIAKTKFEGGGAGASGVASAGSSAVGGGGAQQAQTPNLELFGQANNLNTFFQPEGQEQGQTVQAVISLDQLSTSQDKASQIFESGLL